MEFESLDQLAPPHWWTTRLAAASAVSVVILLILRLLALRAAGNELAGFEQAGHAAGRPWSATDDYNNFDPVEANLFERLVAIAAGRAPHVDGPTNSGISAAENMARRDEWQLKMAAARLSNETIYAGVRQLRLSAEREPVAIESIPSQRPADSLDLIAWLTNELIDHAMDQQLRGDELGMIETERDVLRVIRCVLTKADTHRPLQAAGLSRAALTSIEWITCGLDLSRPGVADGVRRLLVELADNERAINAAAISGIAAGALEDRLRLQAARGNAWLTLPIFVAGAADVCRLQDANQAHAAGGGGTAESNRLAGEFAFLTGRRSGTGALLFPRARPAGALLAASTLQLGYYGELCRRFNVESRLAQVLLAAQLFHADYAAWPAGVDRLVPAYLNAAPRSPYGHGENRVEFSVLRDARRSGRDRPMAYIDLLAAGNAPPAAAAIGWQATDKSAQVIELARQWRDASVWTSGGEVPATYPAAGR